MNSTYQKKAYSGQKKTHLCKPYTIVTTNGFVVDVPGPFYGTENDATIFKKILEKPNGLSKLLKENDVFVLDRSFRDVEPYLRECGFKVLMLSLIHI